MNSKSKANKIIEDNGYTYLRESYNYYDKGFATSMTPRKDSRKEVFLRVKGKTDQEMLEALELFFILKRCGGLPVLNTLVDIATNDCIMVTYKYEDLLRVYELRRGGYVPKHQNARENEQVTPMSGEKEIEKNQPLLCMEKGEQLKYYPKDIKYTLEYTHMTGDKKVPCVTWLIRGILNTPPRIVAEELELLINEREEYGELVKSAKRTTIPILYTIEYEKLHCDYVEEYHSLHEQEHQDY